MLTDIWAAGTGKVGRSGFKWLRGADNDLGETCGKIKLEWGTWPQFGVRSVLARLWSKFDSEVQLCPHRMLDSLKVGEFTPLAYSGSAELII